MMVSSKKGISAHQLHRVLEVQYKSAWFLSHRIREAMCCGDLAPFAQATRGGATQLEKFKEPARQSATTMRRALTSRSGSW